MVDKDLTLAGVFPNQQPTLLNPEATPEYLEHLDKVMRDDKILAFFNEGNKLSLLGELSSDEFELLSELIRMKKDDEQYGRHCNLIKSIWLAVEESMLNRLTLVDFSDEQVLRVAQNYVHITTLLNGMENTNDIKEHSGRAARFSKRKGTSN